MIGQTISHYRIVEKLGEGGMGVVYKAEDLKLVLVALKFLPSHLLESEEHKARFLREARTAALLDHPNICTVYEIDEVDGRALLAMTCLEGQTLKRKIAERPLPLDEALGIALQIGQGLHAAHEKSIVHRDIKPANVMITPQGQVKIMDFGLAQLSGRTKLTASGTKLGTPAYMSPEQAEGKSADCRADIWALGVVFYEMISGRVPFAGEVEAAVTYAILHTEPEPLTALRSDVPVELDRISAKALAKKPADRYQHVDDFTTDLRVLVREASGARARAKSALKQDRVAFALKRYTPWAVAAALGLLLLFRGGAPPPPPTPEPAPPLRKFTLALPGFADVGDTVPTATISPNGQHIIYASAANRKLAVWDLGVGQHRVLEGTERAIMPFWSPDSQSIGFWAEHGEIKRVSAQGGPVTPVAKVSGCCAQATWSPDGASIVFSHNGGLFKVSARGGAPREVSPPSEDERLRFVSPHFLPSGAGRVVVVGSTASTGQRLMLLDLDLGGVENLADVANIQGVCYSPSGHLVYDDARNTIWALPFSLSRRQVAGEPFPIAENGVRPSVASDQTLVYTDVSERSARFIWVNRRGEKTAEIGQPNEALGRYFSLSPDDRFVVEGSSGRPWVHEVDRPTKSVLPFPERASGPLIWSSSGSEILFSTAQGLYIGAKDGSQPTKRIYDAEGYEFASDWSRDGKYVFYDLHGQDVWYLERNAADGFEPHPFLTSEFAEKAARISPDNKWVAYVSDESGTVEVYLRRFPQGDSRAKVSRNGGRGVRWGQDGQRLYYTAGQTLFEVAVRFDPAPMIDAPQKVFEWPGIADVANVSSYSSFDVSADGKRFVVQEPLSQSQSRLTIVQNWHAEFQVIEGQAP
jgi:Tol biopolymer transport system component